jgi:sortase A
VSQPIPPVVGNRTRNRVVQERTRARVVKERIRIGVRGVGEVLITLGLVLLLFCGYQLWWTDVTSSNATNAAVSEFDKTLADTPVTTGAIPPLETPTKGEPFARMFVPRFGSSWVKPIIQGVSLTDLHKGVGHYPKTALPGEVGNFAVAGHRTTNGHPFRKIDDLVLGDKIFVETKDAWYTYEVTESGLIVDPKGGYYVVSPTGKKNSTAAPTEKLMTLTSCHPPYSASQRIIAHAKLTDVRARGLGPPPGAPSGAT